MKIGVQIKLKHGVLYEAMLRHGMNQTQMAEHLRVSPNLLCSLMNMNHVPSLLLKKDGFQSALELFCGCDIEEIFPEELRTNKVFLATKKKFNSFVEADPQYLLERTQSQMMLESPLARCQREQAEMIVDGVISTLTERQADVVRKRNFEGMTFEQIGESRGITSARASQIYCKALNRLRDRSRRARLLEANELMER